MATNRVSIVCPSCKFAKEVPESAVPSGRRTIGCPRCKTRFQFDRAATPSPTAPRAGANETAAPAKPMAPAKSAPAAAIGVVATPDSGAASAPRTRNLRVFAGLVAALLVVGTVLAGAAQLFHWQPIIAEKFWFAGLLSGVAPVQEASIRALRAHPTRNTAVALVAFINLKNLHRAPDPKNPETAEDREKRLAARTRDLHLAERATETLCLLSGHSFGTRFKKEPGGHSWPGMAERDWPRVLGEINLWSVRMLGEMAIPARSSATSPQHSPGTEVTS